MSAFKRAFGAMDENKAICISSQPGKPKERLTKHEHLNTRVKYEKAYLKWFYMIL